MFTNGMSVALRCLQVKNNEEGKQDLGGKVKKTGDQNKTVELLKHSTEGAPGKHWWDVKYCSCHTLPLYLNRQAQTT